MDDLKKLINLDNLNRSLKNFKNNSPFDHCICEDFFSREFADKIIDEFPNYEQEGFWHEYNNKVEIKKTCNDWNKFKKNTYLLFTTLNSFSFTQILSKAFDMNLFPDFGLNGGGLHTHKNGGKLNFHLDYDIHPKLIMQRRINLIIFLNPDWDISWGGELGFWSNDEQNKKPNKLIKKIAPIFNRAVFFDTSQNSWHGLVSKVQTTNNSCRNSVAVYYLTSPRRDVSDRAKALYAPTKDQENDKSVLNFIKQRSDIKLASKKYIED